MVPSATIKPPFIPKALLVPGPWHKVRHQPLSWPGGNIKRATLSVHIPHRVRALSPYLPHCHPHRKPLLWRTRRRLCVTREDVVGLLPPWERVRLASSHTWNEARGCHLPPWGYTTDNLYIKQFIFFFFWNLLFFLHVFLYKVTIRVFI